MGMILVSLLLTLAGCLPALKAFKPERFNCYTDTLKWKMCKDQQKQYFRKKAPS